MGKQDMVKSRSAQLALQSCIGQRSKAAQSDLQMSSVLRVSRWCVIKMHQQLNIGSVQTQQI